MIYRSPAHHHKNLDSGFSIVESLVVVVVVGLALAASTTMFVVALRGNQNTSTINLEQASIENNKVLIDQLARNYTCCSGSCSATPPATGTFGATQPCATNNPNDVRYYFPQLDLASTTTTNEPAAVDSLCATANNTSFMTPFKTAVDALAQPTPATRLSSVINPYKTLRIDFNNSNGQLVRTLYVRPRMASFCS